MKYTLILLFFMSISSFAQIRGSIVLGGDFSNSQFNEYPHLKDIADIQKEITRYQSAIAIEQASMVVLEEKLYKGISKKENFIGGLKIIIRITDAQKNINDWLESIEELVKDVPDLKNAFQKKEILVILKTSVFISDIIIATKEDDSNLMNSKQRYEVLHKILDNIQIVEQQVASLYYFFKSVKTIIAINNYDPIEHDYTKVLSQLKNNYDVIFPDNLKDDDQP